MADNTPEADCAVLKSDRAHRPRVLCGAVLAASLLLGPPVAAHASGATASNPGSLQVTGRALQRWVAANELGRRLAPTPAEATQQAQNYDVIVATQWTYQTYVSAMKAANPNLVLLVYLNGSYAYSNQGSTYPASWYERDAAGSQIQHGKSGNYLMDPTNPGWISDRQATCTAAREASGYDGCYVDMLNQSPLLGGYDTGLPINIATGLVWTAPDWMAAVANLGAAIQATTGGHPAVGNGLTSGPVFYGATGSPSSRLLDGMSGGAAEIWLRQPNAAITSYPGLVGWKQNVDMLAASTRSVLTITKTWTNATQAQIDACHSYALASFLLGTNGMDYFEFTPNATVSGIMTDSPLDHLDVGSATGPYQLSGGVYRRSFAKGLAVVNPGTATVSVSLGGTYRDVNGVPTSSITMTSNSGAVFTS